MHILVATTPSVRGRVGGGQTYVAREIEALQARGHRVSVITEDERPSAGAEWRHEEAVGFGHPGTTGVAHADDSDVWMERNRGRARRTADAIRSLKPDVIHANGMKALLVIAAARLGVPCVVTIHHPGIVCPIGTMTRPDRSRCRRVPGDRTCASCYCRQRRWGRHLGGWLGAIPESLSSSLSEFLAPLPGAAFLSRALRYPRDVRHALQERRMLHREAGHWIAPSRAALALLQANGVAADRIHLVPHGIVPLARTPILDRGPLRFGYVGEWSLAKGLDLLLSAFSSGPSALGCELHVFGAAPATPEGQAFAATVRRRTPAGVRLHGPFHAGAIESAYATFDVLVVPGTFLEIFGLVVLEAMSAGRPVIASRCGGPEDSIRDGIDGLLVPRGNSGALAASMMRLATAPAEVRRLAGNLRPVRTMDEHAADLERVFGVALRADRSRGSGAGGVSGS